MFSIDIVIDKDLAEADIGDDLKREISVYRRLKPLISHCLTLNHEINNSLGGIIGYAELMLTENISLSKNQRQNLQQIVRCAERIERQIGKLGNRKSNLAGEIDIKAVTAAYKQATGPLEQVVQFSQDPFQGQGADKNQ